MSLVSNLFLLFVAASILIYYIVPRKSQWIVLLIFSYLYYIAGGPRYVVFILFSTLGGVRHYGTKNDKNRNKWKS